MAIRHRKKYNNILRNYHEMVIDISDVENITFDKGIKVIKKKDRISVVVPRRMYRDLERTLSQKGFEIKAILPSVVKARGTNNNPGEYIGVRRLRNTIIVPHQSYGVTFKAFAKGGTKLPKPGSGKGKQNGKKNKGEAN